MVERAVLLAEVERRLGPRRLVWAGLRGDDTEPLADLPQLAASFAIAGAYAMRGRLQTVAYEDLTGVRVDPEIWDIDDHLRDEPTLEFRHELLRALNGSIALLPYRPSQFLSAAFFARRGESSINLGISGAQQAAFEHKPWVEVGIKKLDIPQIPWVYIADQDQLKARQLAGADGKSIVLRKSRTSGGEGFTHLATFDDLVGAWPTVNEAFVSVAPFIDGALPVNVGATVWKDGVTVHHPSVQLIGIDSCVTREFGYCGNDFGAASSLSPGAVDQIEVSTTRIGSWLRDHGYRGSFGVDYLVKDSVPLFTEVNPRFQGSTHASCRLSIEAGEACLMLEHVAAWLDISCPKDCASLRTRVRETPDLVNLVVHWTGETRSQTDALALVDHLSVIERSTRADLVTPDGVLNDCGSAVVRLMMRRRVTETGYDLDPSLEAIIGQWRVAQEGPKG
ncbi:ATP-grasp domain-containing protein [Gordonia jacobaea]|uniref:ATP-grasp domain-containing protein n=1 Tax=Gordonia jacobaea TaxID=122202 RepID=UPI003D7095F8